MPEDRTRNLAETERGSYYNQEEWLKELLDDQGAFYNGIESDDSDNDDENYNENIRADVRRCFSICFSQISRERICVGVSFECLKACNFIKYRLQHRCFPMKFANFLRRPFLQNNSGGCF